MPRNISFLKSKGYGWQKHAQMQASWMAVLLITGSFWMHDHEIQSYSFDIVRNVYIHMITSRNTLPPSKTMVVDFDNLTRDCLIWNTKNFRFCLKWIIFRLLATMFSNFYARKVLHEIHHDLGLLFAPLWVFTGNVVYGTPWLKLCNGRLIERQLNRWSCVRFSSPLDAR